MKTNAATQILAALGVYGMLLGDKVSFRGATSKRVVNRTAKGRTPGGYGRGLTNHFNRKRREAVQVE
jgi:hypothetical protein